MPVDVAFLAALALAGAVGYLVGSFSSGYIVGRLYRNVDLRTLGSGSTGATNTARNLGLGAGVLVGVLDVGKGALAVFLAGLLVPFLGRDVGVAAQALAAMGAVLGHCFPFFLAGRGGRGIATGVGALLFIASPAVVVAVLFFAIGVAITRIVSVGSLLSVVGALLGYLALSWLGLIAFHPAALAYIVVAGSIIVIRHRGNIRRLLAGREPRIGQPLRS